MAYQIKFTPTAREDFLGFDKEFQRRLANKIEKLATAPDIYGKPLKGIMAGKWELRFEKRWRILYTINKNESQVEIIGVWHKDDF